MWTLTFRDERATLTDAWKAIDGFRRRIEDEGLGPVLVVIEEGSKNGRLHFHVAATRYVSHARLVDLWGHGFVFAQQFKSSQSDKFGPESKRARARRVAGYLAKYLGKGEGDGGGLTPTADEGEDGGSSSSSRWFNRRRYSTSRASHPEPVQFVAFSLVDAIGTAMDLCGADLVQVWHSDESQDWRGPPTFMFQSGR